MTNTVYIDDYREALKEMREELTAIFGEEISRCICFYELNSRTEPTKMGVNWYALGTTTSEATKEFGKALIIASDLAEGFKYNGYKITY